MFKQLKGLPTDFACNYLGCTSHANYLVTFSCCSLKRYYCLHDLTALKNIYESQYVKCGNCGKIKKFGTVGFV